MAYDPVSKSVGALFGDKFTLDAIVNDGTVRLFLTCDLCNALLWPSPTGYRQYLVKLEPLLQAAGHHVFHCDKMRDVPTVR